MDRGRVTCGGQNPTAPTTRLIRGYSLRINAHYATQLGPRSMRERTEMLGGDLRVDTGSGTRASAVGAAETNAAAGNNVAANFDAARYCTTVQW
jgi:hypothetical protein